MASTRLAMHAIESSQADLDVVADLLAAQTDVEAAIAFSLLRGEMPDRELLMLVNLRELLRELPDAPFRTGEDLGILERSGGYEDSGRSYRRVFESAHGVFGIEFLGRERLCEGVVVRTPSTRCFLTGGEGPFRLDETSLSLFVHHAILLDAVFEALELLGCSLEPKIYITTDDFVTEHCAAAAGEAFAELF